MKEGAIREGLLAVDLEPICKSAFFGPNHVRNLSVIYSLVGDFDSANVPHVMERQPHPVHQSPRQRQLPYINLASYVFSVMVTASVRCFQEGVKP